MIARTPILRRRRMCLSEAPLKIRPQALKQAFQYSEAILLMWEHLHDAVPMVVIHYLKWARTNVQCALG
jgi:hypothetical protein